MAEEKKTEPMLDPIAYRSDYRPEDIQEEYRDDPNLPWVWPLKANENFNEYWDDSNPSWQWYRGWLNPKYEWEWVANSIIDYNPNITTSDLDPNYLFWRAVQETKNKEDNYLAKRNDNIASALYNEWKITKADIANYLAQQNWWMNSTEADRYNTIESIWKRLWQIKPQEKEEVDTSKIEEDLNQWTAGTIYGKTTAQEWDATEWINTLEDKNSVFKAMEVARVAAVEEMLNMWVDSLAAMQYSWTNPYNETNWRDFRKYYPDMAAQVDQKVKEMNSQDVVNAISSGSDMPSSNNTTWNVNNEIADFSNKNANSNNSSEQISQNINTFLDKNSTAQTAQELMWNLEAEMATLKNRMKNLKNEVTSYFKWDAPDYLVNAAMSNKAQELQNQLSILEDRYNAAYNRYKTEVSNAQWQAEFDLKKEEFEWKKESANVTDWLDANGIDISSLNSGSTKTVSSMSREEIGSQVDELLQAYKEWKLGNAQCAAWLQKYYFPRIWVELTNLSSYDAKKSLINTDSSYTPQKWDLIIMSSSSAPENWHIWLVTNVVNWRIYYLDWNWSVKDWVWTEKPMQRVINADNARIQWYRDVTKWATESEWVEELTWWQSYDWKLFNVDYAKDYETFINSSYSAVSRPEKTAEKLWMSLKEFRTQAYTYKAAKDAWMLDVNDPLLRNGWKWIWLNGKTYDLWASKLYKNLSDTDKQAVRDMLDNRIWKQYINNNRTKYDNPAWIFSAVTDLDPTWSDTLWTNRQKAENKRSTSEIWWYVSKNKTAMSRARRVYELADTLEDKNWSKVSKFLKNNNIKTLKDLANWKEEEIWNTDVVRIKTALDGFINEYAWALKWWNASNAVEDILREEAIFDMALSQEQLKAAMEEAARTLYDKDVTEISDLAKRSYTKQPITWLEEDANWLYETVWLPLDKYYDYVPVGWVAPKEDKTTSQGTWKFNLMNLFK